MRFYKQGGRGSIDPVCKMGGINNDSVLTNTVLDEAICFNSAGWNVWQELATEGITKQDLSSISQARR